MEEIKKSIEKFEFCVEKIEIMSVQAIKTQFYSKTQLEFDPTHCLDSSRRFQFTILFQCPTFTN